MPERFNSNSRSIARRSKRSLWLGVAVTLAACGGGGGSEPPPATTYVVGGNVTGLVGTLVLQNNGADSLVVTADGAFSFAAPVAQGNGYTVSVLTQPAGRTCSVSNASGTAASAVSNVAVSCVASGGGGGAAVARITLTVRGLYGTERDMMVRYVIADGPTSRDAASALRPTPFGCWSEAGPACQIDVPVGKTISFFAIEGEGYVAADAGNGRPVPPPDPLRHEFASFGGDCATAAALGECVFHVSSAGSYNVRADFAQMQPVVFQMLGAGALGYSFTARDRLAFPNRPYLNTAPPGRPGGSAPYVPTAPLIYGYLPSGSTVTATRFLVGAGLSAFIQWNGSCSAGGGVLGSCTLTAGGTPTPVATAVFEYYDCGSQGYTDGGTGPTPPPGCTKVRP